MKIIVTAGAKGADIDVFACVVAYSELLNLEGDNSEPVIRGQFTMSVTPSILSWGAKYLSEYRPDGNDRFVLVDISDPEHFPNFVDHERINEVYDHRAGHEDHWREKLSDTSHIEMVGSCGTLIWEEYKKRGKSEQISNISAKLLLASIVSNNLNFRSPLTTDRDIIAYSELSKITGLSDKWIVQYFLEQEDILMNDFEKYLRADTKTFKISTDNFAIGQIELWDANKLLENKEEIINTVMKEVEPIPWVVNILNISNSFNYIYSTNQKGKEILEKKLHISFDGNIAKTKDLLMRKYIMKVLRN